MLGVLFLDRGELEAAERQIARALRIGPNVAAAHNNRGIALKELDRFEEALDSYDRAIALKSDYAEAFNNRGVVLKRLGRLADALISYDKAIELNPSYTDALNNRGNVLMDLDRGEDALASYDRAIALKPNYGEAFNNRGAALLSLGRVEEALKSCQTALALKTAHAGAFCNIGIIYQTLMRYEDALASYDKAIALNPAYAQAFNNRGNALRRLGRQREAVASFDRAIAIHPDETAYNNRGNAFAQLLRLDEAEIDYGKALSLRPDYPEASVNLAYVKLIQGRMAEGWEDYEKRWMKKDFQHQRPNLDAPRWTGDDIRGRSILVHDEQGLGDIIQFSRYVPLLADRGAKVTFLVPAKLEKLLNTLPGSVPIVTSIRPEDKFDVQCPLLSLPRCFNTDLTNIPAPVPYLAADPERCSVWRAKIGTHGFRIGVCWHSKPNIPERSFPLRELHRLSQKPGVRLISLQKEYGLDQLQSLPPGMTVEDFTAELDSGPDAFLDTAALMMQLDLIVTSDTSIAHLAGALGRPVWIALAFSSEWRWLLGRSDSVWYPTVRLFRQEKAADWGPVFERMAAALTEDDR